MAHWRQQNDSCSTLLFEAEVPNVRTDNSTVVCPEDGHIVVRRNLRTALPSTPHSTCHHAHSREALLFRLPSTDQPKGQSSQIPIATQPTLYGQLTITNRLIPHSACGRFVCYFKDLIQLVGLFLAYITVTVGQHNGLAIQLAWLVMWHVVEE